MFIKLVILQEYSAFDEHRNGVFDKSANLIESTIPYGILSIKNDGLGSEAEVFRFVEDLVSWWSSSWNTESRSSLIIIPDDIGFKLNIMGIHEYDYLVYDIESGRIGFSSSMNHASNSISNRNSNKSSITSSRRGRSGSNSQKNNTPFFDFNPVEYVEPSLYEVSDGAEQTELEEMIKPYVIHTLMECFKCVFGDIRNDIFESDRPNFNHYYDEDEFYTFASNPLIRRLSRHSSEDNSRNELGYTRFDAEMVMHIIRNNDMILNRVKLEMKTEYRTFMDLKECIEYEIEMGLHKETK